MFIDSLRMKTKLFALFGGIILLMMAVTFISAIKIFHIEEELKKSEEVRIPVLVLASQTAANAMNIGRYSRGAINEMDDHEAVEKTILQIDKLRKENAVNLDKMQALIVTPKAKELFQAVSESRYALRPHYEIFYNKIRAGNIKEAQSYLKTQYAPANNKYYADLNALASFVEEATRESTKEQRESVENLNVLMLSATAVAIVIALLLATFLAKNISNRLSRCVDAANAIANGRLDAVIPTEGKDEIAELGVSMLKMQTDLHNVIHQIQQIAKSANEGNFHQKISTADKQGFGLELSEALNSLVNTAEEGLNDVILVAQALADGDLSKSISKEYPGLFGQAISAINTTVNSLATIMGEINTMVGASVAGDFSRRIALHDKKGYGKALSEQLNKLSETTDAGLKDVCRVAKALAAGDLTHTIDHPYPGLFGETRTAVNTTVDHLRELISNIIEAVDAIHTAASEIAAGNNDLSSRTEEQASSLEETAASMEELTSMVHLNMDHAKQANLLAASSASTAEKGGKVVTASVQTMEEIEASSQKISDIISVIDGIAFQTNILALNAAVEAARAGEHGRGFAVVASEVRNLALRASGAAKEIKDLITESVDKINLGAQQAEHAGKTMDEIIHAISNVSHVITDITNASQEQTSGIDQVNQAVTQMDQVTQQNAALVEEAAAAAESLEDQARQLQSIVSHFRLR